jgi:hypothetical protein
MTAGEYPPVVGDIGYTIVLPIGNPLGITDLTSCSFKVLKPDDSEESWTTTTLGDSNMYYDTVSGDFDQEGVYKIQPYAEYSGGQKLYGEAVDYLVYDNYEVATTWKATTVTIASLSYATFYAAFRTFCDDRYQPKLGSILIDRITDGYEGQWQTSGDGAPTSIPAAVGLEYLDTTNKRLYKSYGTSSVSDWVYVASFDIFKTFCDNNYQTKSGSILVTQITDGYNGVWQTSGAGAPSTIPTAIGLEYLDTTAKKLYKSFGTSAVEDWVVMN